VRILDNVQLDANSYIIKIKEVESGSGKVWYGQYMVMDPAGKQVTLPGVHTTEPTFGLPATWIEPALKEEASVRGYTVVDSATVLATHLTELIKANMSELLSYGDRLPGTLHSARLKINEKMGLGGVAFSMVYAALIAQG